MVRMLTGRALSPAIQFALRDWLLRSGVRRRFRVLIIFVRGDIHEKDASYEERTRVYAHRATRRYRHHLRFDRVTLARSAIGARGCSPHSVHKQPEATRTRFRELREHELDVVHGCYDVGRWQLRERG